MSYQEDVALVLEAMGARLIGHYWMKFGGPRGDGSAVLEWMHSAIDANFIVERVIPWAAAQDIKLTLRYWKSYWLCLWRLPRNRSDAEFAPDMPEAVMAALAAALRAGQ